MTTDTAGSQPRTTEPAAPLLCPFSLRVDRFARMLNCELADHPVYTGLELQWFEDEVHGTGLLAFLERREDRLVDYHAAPGLRLDRDGYAIGGGTGSWEEVVFERDRFELVDDGVVVDVAFRDRHGRSVEIALDDRAAGRRTAGRLLAPVGAGVEAPRSLLLVDLHGFDLVRRSDVAPTIRIDGEEAAIGRLPGRWLHRRELVKVAAPVTVATVCPVSDGPLLPVDVDAPGEVVLGEAGATVVGIAARSAGAAADLHLSPGLGSFAELPDGREVRGRWWINVDGSRLTGGVWRAERRDDRVRLGLDVTERWRPPRGQPLLVRVVTRVVPVFRRWPTTYRWRAEVRLGQAPTLRGGWERIGQDRGQAYRRATGS